MNRDPQKIIVNVISVIFFFEGGVLSYSLSIEIQVLVNRYLIQIAEDRPGYQNCMQSSFNVLPITSQSREE